MRQSFLVAVLTSAGSIRLIIGGRPVLSADEASRADIALGNTHQASSIPQDASDLVRSIPLRLPRPDSRDNSSGNGFETSDKEIALPAVL